jgi:hypothetical protein
MDEKCKSVASFGSLKHFRKEEKPEGAGSKCMDCSYEPKCPYSAVKLYLNLAKEGKFEWPNNVITSDLTLEGITKAVAEGPYGKCVYDCDNDVVDNQVVAMEYNNGKTVNFTMTAFTELTYRRTSIFGTRGELYGDGDKIEIFDFMTDTRKSLKIEVNDDSPLSGHGNGDESLMQAFINAVSENNPKYILSGLQETMDSHKLVFAAEKSRKEGKVVKL